MFSNIFGKINLLSYLLRFTVNICMLKELRSSSGNQPPYSTEHSAKTFFYGSLPAEVPINISGILFSFNTLWTILI